MKSLFLICGVLFLVSCTKPSSPYTTIQIERSAQVPIRGVGTPRPGGYNEDADKNKP